jgi:predicted PurR-regulated permease PerM
MRRGLAVALTVLLLDGGLIAFAAAVVVSFGQLATVLPQYSDEWQGLLDGVRSTLADIGIGQQQVQDALRSVQPGTALSAVAGVLSGLVGSVAALVLVLATVLFMTAEAAGLPARLAPVPGSRHLRTALGEFARNTRRYIVVTTVFGLIVAVVDTIALLVLGVPLALLWGLLSFLTNYVPNIGFLLGLAPPTLLAALVGGPGLAILVIVIYSLANFVLQSVVQPVFVGDAVGLSVTLSFLSVIVWTVVLGPIGAVLAVPLTLFAHAVLIGQDPDRQWARTLLAGTSASVPATTGGRARRRPGRRGRPDPADGAAPSASSAGDDAGQVPRPQAPVVEQRPERSAGHLEAGDRPAAGGSP